MMRQRETVTWPLRLMPAEKQITIPHPTAVQKVGEKLAAEGRDEEMKRNEGMQVDEGEEEEEQGVEGQEETQVYSVEAKGSHGQDVPDKGCT
eukprot:756222-Hanusia_phi.AAC.6